MIQDTDQNCCGVLPFQWNKPMDAFFSISCQAVILLSQVSKAMSVQCNCANLLVAPIKGQCSTIGVLMLALALSKA